MKHPTQQDVKTLPVTNCLPVICRYVILVRWLPVYSLPHSFDWRLKLGLTILTQA